MKLLTIAVPCYNSAAYMEDCIKTLLPGGEDVEILIVDDGSKKDNTAEIADRLEKEYPGIIRAIHQENGGHGEAVNTGLKNATGLYFKVVDSDDHLDPEAYKEVIKKLKEFSAPDKEIDLLLSNYIYDKEGATNKKLIQYRSALPIGRVFSWDEIGHFKKGQYILMHSCIYRTEMLRECNLALPSHTFYVDNIYVFKPLPFVKKIYYLDVNFYKYYIGREDQSVNEKVMIGRIDQQIRVSEIMFDYYSDYLKHPSNEKLVKYMYNYLEIMMVVSSILAILEGSPEYLKKKDDYWNYMKDHDEKLYNKLKHGALGTAMNFKTPLGRKVAKHGYKIAQKIFKFN